MAPALRMTRYSKRRYQFFHCDHGLGSWHGEEVCGDQRTWLQNLEIWHSHLNKSRGLFPGNTIDDDYWKLPSYLVCTVLVALGIDLAPIFNSAAPISCQPWS
ncbi:hypothetical protein N656DRAFT_398172 [Canariomyces notabilis]|uniref:Uncharacterized protein n=1 Tax=Canariomyces notabilis TaxID=2074819 RepID=A0AAN6TKJ3_9PEZI|nr:hypothetical protein N656DRAFT_398172 [Canariomyces arenarius]